MTRRARHKPKEVGAAVPRPQAMDLLAQRLHHTLNGTSDPPLQGFLLLVFPYAREEGTPVHFVSNTDPAQMISALRDVAAQIEADQQEREKMN